jgi:LysR family transcriptional regulator, benzoate and cis,cis-muconate-responsive activator of ben and cat genes
VDLRQLNYFLAVAEHLNFTKAAETLYMATSPLSRSIQALENELGGRLFERGTRHVRLTEAGEMLVPKAQDALASIAAISHTIRFQLNEHRHLDVGIRAVPTMLRTKLTDEVFRRALPTAEVHYHPNRPAVQTEELLRGNIAFAVTAGTPSDSRVGFLPLMIESMALVLPDRPEFATKTTVEPEDLAGLFLIVHPDLADKARFEPLFEHARDLTTIDVNIQGAVLAAIADGEHAAIAAANPDSPGTKSIVGDGVIIRPLPARFYYATYLAWLHVRDRPDDLGPSISAARAAFPEPLAF